MKIYHAADIHLGRQRLDGRLPEEDFATAFRFIAEQAVQQQADVFVLAGDLFDRPQVEPRHLRQAQEILHLLYRAKIPVVAIEGNHDKALIHSADSTWVGFLAQDGLLSLLRPQFGPEGAILAEYDARAIRGSFLDVAGVRFVGGGYLGAATPAKVRQIAAALESNLKHVLLLHAGPDYFVGEGGGFSQEDLAAVREKVAYVALGHIHKPMVYDNWACNPGSPENCDLRESAYSRNSDGTVVARGFAIVEIDPARPGRPVKLEVCSNPRRPVCHLEVDCTPFGNKLKEGESYFVKAVVKAIKEIGPAPDAVVEVRLSGYMNLNRISLDPGKASVEISQAANVFAVALDTSRLNFGQLATGIVSAPGMELSREELEKQAIRNVAAEEPVCSTAGNPEQCAALFFELKEAVKIGRDPQALAELIANSPLVEALRASKQEVATARAATPVPEAVQVGI